MTQSGYKTTEFWLCVCVLAFLAYLSATGLYPAEQAVEKAFLILAGYIGQRSWLKSGTTPKQ